MAEPIYVIVNTGGVTSGAFALTHPQFPLVVQVPSLTASEVRPQFSAVSGSGFSDLMRYDGSGVAFVVHSGAGPAIGVLTRPPSPWGRVSVITSQTAVRTFTLFPTR